MAAGANLNRGTYTGLAGPVYIEPKHEAGAYDREIFLVMKEFSPSFSRGGDMAMDMLASGEPIKELKEAGAKADEESKGTAKGYEVGYELFSINGKMLGAAEPIRVKQGERVLFHVLNASATEIPSLALPGHVFRVVALDGNPVPTAADVPVLWLGTAERISAIVDMNHPGVFVLGDLSDDDRRHGMGMAMEQRPPRIIGDEVKSDLLEAALMVVLVKERPAPVTAKARIDLSFRQFPRGYWRYLLATALFGLGNSSNSFLILQTKQLGASLETTILIYAGFNLVAALISYPAGFLSDKWGRRNILIAALLVFLRRLYWLCLHP